MRKTKILHTSSKLGKIKALPEQFDENDIITVKQASKIIGCTYHSLFRMYENDPDFPAKVMYLGKKMLMRQDVHEYVIVRKQNEIAETIERFKRVDQEIDEQKEKVAKAKENIKALRTIQSKLSAKLKQLNKSLAKMKS
jgi:seryl-tRNA synthetase